jgi:hypothetical protein
MRDLTSDELRLISGGLTISLGSLGNLTIDVTHSVVGGTGGTGGADGSAGGAGIGTLNGGVNGVNGLPGSQLGL